MERDSRPAGDTAGRHFLSKKILLEQALVKANSPREVLF